MKKEEEENIHPQEEEGFQEYVDPYNIYKSVVNDTEEIVEKLLQEMEMKFLEEEQRGEKDWVNIQLGKEYDEEIEIIVWDWTQKKILWELVLGSMEKEKILERYFINWIIWIMEKTIWERYTKLKETERGKRGKEISVKALLIRNQKEEQTKFEKETERKYQIKNRKQKEKEKQIKEKEMNNERKEETEENKELTNDKYIRERKEKEKTYKETDEKEKKKREKRDNYGNNLEYRKRLSTDQLNVLEIKEDKIEEYYWKKRLDETELFKIEEELEDCLKYNNEIILEEIMRVSSDWKEIKEETERIEMRKEIIIGAINTYTEQMRRIIYFKGTEVKNINYKISQGYSFIAKNEQMSYAVNLNHEEGMRTRNRYEERNKISIGELRFIIIAWKNIMDMYERIVEEKERNMENINKSTMNNTPNTQRGTGLGTGKDFNPLLIDKNGEKIELQGCKNIFDALDKEIIYSMKNEKEQEKEELRNKRKKEIMEKDIINIEERLKIHRDQTSKDLKNTTLWSNRYANIRKNEIFRYIEQNKQVNKKIGIDIEFIKKSEERKRGMDSKRKRIDEFKRNREIVIKNSIRRNTMRINKINKNKNIKRNEEENNSIGIDKREEKEKNNENELLIEEKIMMRIKERDEIYMNKIEMMSRVITEKKKEEDRVMTLIKKNIIDIKDINTHMEEDKRKKDEKRMRKEKKKKEEIERKMIDEDDGIIKEEKINGLKNKIVNIEKIVDNLLGKINLQQKETEDLKKEIEDLNEKNKLYKEKNLLREKDGYNMNKIKEELEIKIDSGLREIKRESESLEEKRNKRNEENINEKLNELKDEIRSEFKEEIQLTDIKISKEIREMENEIDHKLQENCIKKENLRSEFKNMKDSLSTKILGKILDKQLKYYIELKEECKKISEDYVKEMKNSELEKNNKLDYLKTEYDLTKNILLDKLEMYRQEYRDMMEVNREKKMEIDKLFREQKELMTKENKEYISDKIEKLEISLIREKKEKKYEEKRIMRNLLGNNYEKKKYSMDKMLIMYLANQMENLKQKGNEKYDNNVFRNKVEIKTAKEKEELKTIIEEEKEDSVSSTSHKSEKKMDKKDNNDVSISELEKITTIKKKMKKETGDNVVKKSIQQINIEFVDKQWKTLNNLEYRIFINTAEEFFKEKINKDMIMGGDIREFNDNENMYMKILDSIINVDTKYKGLEMKNRIGEYYKKITRGITEGMEDELDEEEFDYTINESVKEHVENFTKKKNWDKSKEAMNTVLIILSKKKEYEEIVVKMENYVRKMYVENIGEKLILPLKMYGIGVDEEEERKEVELEQRYLLDFLWELMGVYWEPV